MATVHTITNEAARGCGFRKEGGMYLISNGLSSDCGALPVPLTVCPCCGGGVKFSRAFTRIDTRELFGWLKNEAACENLGIEPLDTPCAMDPGKTLMNAMYREYNGDVPAARCQHCPINSPPETAGLIWIGKAHYKATSDFTREAAIQGVSRRIRFIPPWFDLGETWVFLAHVDAVPYVVTDSATAQTTVKHKPGLFHAFRPDRIEYITTGDETEAELDALEDRGLTLVDLVRTEIEPELPLDVQEPPEPATVPVCLDCGNNPLPDDTECGACGSGRIQDVPATA